MSGNCVCKSQHKTSPQVHEGEKSIPLFIFFILLFKKILFVENLLGVCYLSRHNDWPEDVSVHVKIDTNKHILFSWMQISTIGLCVLKYLLIRGLILLLAEWGRETGMKNPRNQRTQSCRDLWKRACNMTSNDSGLLASPLALNRAEE